MKVWVAMEYYDYEGGQFVAVAKTLAGIKNEVAEHRKDQGYDRPLKWQGKDSQRGATRPRWQNGGPDYYELWRQTLYD